MSFLDVALQTKEFQYLWFIKLVETQGLEAANKFTDILRQVPTLASTTAHHQQTHKKLNALIPSQADLFLENLLNPNKDVLVPTNLQQSAILHQSQNTSISNGNAMMGVQGNSKSLLENVDLFGNLSSPLPNELPLIGSNSSTSSQQSVPLYRRQAGQNYQNSTASSSNAHSIASSTSDLLDNHLQQTLFEALDNKQLHPNNGGMMFGGQNMSQYGTGDQTNGFQGFPSVHNIAAGLMQQQHNLNSREFWHQLQQQQQHHLHENRNSSVNSTVEELLNRQNQTYASVLSQAGNKQHSGGSKDGNGGSDGGAGSGNGGIPFAALRDLGRKSNGFYNYFQ